MSLFELIAEWLRPYLDCLPTVAHRPAANEWMVVDGPCRLRESRWFQPYIPAVTHIAYLPKEEKTADLGVQRITSKCGQTVIVNATARLRVVDPILTRDTVGEEDWLEAAAMELRAFIKSLVHGHQYHDVYERFEGDAPWDDAIESRLSCIGVECTVFTVEDFQPCGSISLVQ